jgi:hypothetical protein
MILNTLLLQLQCVQVQIFNESVTHYRRRNRKDIFCSRLNQAKVTEVTKKKKEEKEKLLRK